MPSPRAVLIDIHDQKLDPKKSYTAIRSSGRLRKHAVAVPEAAASEPEKPLRCALVALPAEPDAVAVKAPAAAEEAPFVSASDIPAPKPASKKVGQQKKLAAKAEQ